MKIPASVQPYWDAFQCTVQYDATARFYEVFHFDDNESDANELARLVLNGSKRATASLLWTYQVQNKPLPQKGALSVVTDWHGRPVCIIESTVVDIVPYREVTEEFAAREGEGDRTLEYWRRVHWMYFNRECERLEKLPSEVMQVVCEQFEVVYKQTSEGNW